MIGRVLKWGNSYGIRLSKADVERLGVRAGADVSVQMRPLEGKKVDISHIRFFHGDADLSERHDDFGWA